MVDFHPFPVYLFDDCAFALWCPDMSGIVALVILLMTLSPSTPECERPFSSMNSIKTSSRTALGQATLCDMMLIACDGPSPQQTQEENSWPDCGHHK